MTYAAGAKPVCDKCGFGSAGGAPARPAAMPGAAPAMGPPAYAQGGMQPTGQKKGLGIASLVTGILSVCPGIFLSWGALVLAVLGIVFGAIQLSKIKKQPHIYGGKGLAMAGLILGCVAFAVILLLILVFAAFLASLGAGGLAALDENNAAALVRLLA